MRLHPRQLSHPSSLSLYKQQSITELSVIPLVMLTFQLSSNVQERVWMWHNEGGEYFYDKGEWVRVRIEEEHWNDMSPVAPSERGIESNDERRSPYSLLVSGLLPVGEP